MRYALPYHRRGHGTLEAIPTPPLPAHEKRLPLREEGDAGKWSSLLQKCTIATGPCFIVVADIG
jgi:hypothetical protein